MSAAVDVVAIAKGTLDYLRKDYNEWQGLDIDFNATICGIDIGRYEYQDEDIIIVPRGPNAVVIEIPNFTRLAKKWNGASIVPNRLNALNVGSLPHDFIADKAKAIAKSHNDLARKTLPEAAWKANFVRERDVLRWSDRILCAVSLRAADELGERRWWMKVKLWGIRNGLWKAPRSLWRAVAASCICIALAGCSGCLSPTGDATVETMTPAAEVNAATDTGKAVK